MTLKRIGRYEVRGLLGHGAAGQVFLAHDTLMDREVAIKLVEQSGSPGRLTQELKTLAKLAHPGIVAIHDAGEHDGKPFLVMAYAGDRTLASAELSIREAAEILIQVLEACHYIHGQGVVHRDLKPANIILGERPAIADFGIAKLLESDARLTKTGQLVGTPAYMAPEQVGGGEIGPWTDVYAVGVILYEQLCGRLPFQGESFIELAAQIASDVPPPSPHSVNPDVPKALARITLRALSPEPAERYGSAAEFAEALSDWVEGGKPDLLPAVAAALVVVFLLMAGWVLLGGSDDRQPTIASEATRSKHSAPPTPSPRTSSGPPKAEPSAPAIKTSTRSAAPSPRTSGPSPLPTKPPTPSPTPSPKVSLDSNMIARWVRAPPTRAQVATAFSDAHRVLGTTPSREEVRSFLRLVWKTLIRALNERWAALGPVKAFAQLARHPTDRAEGALIAANAWLLRWWFERTTSGATRTDHYSKALSSLEPAQEAKLWEARATAAVTFVLAVHNNDDRPRWQRLLRQRGTEAIADVERSAPRDQALWAELRRLLR